METPIGKRVVLSRRSIAQVTKKCLEVEATKNCNLTTKKGQSDLGIGVVGGV